MDTPQYLKLDSALLLIHPFLIHELRHLLLNQKQILLRFLSENDVSMLLLKGFLHLELYHLLGRENHF